MFDKILDVWQNSKFSDEKLPTTDVGNLLLPLPPKSFDLHETQRQQDEILDWPHIILISLKENSSTGWIRLKSVWIIVAHISGWWDSPLALQSFSWSIAGTPNKKIRHSISPITDLYQIGHNIRIYNPITKRPPGNRTSTSVTNFSLLTTCPQTFSHIFHPTTIYT